MYYLGTVTDADTLAIIAGATISSEGHSAVSDGIGQYSLEYYPLVGYFDVLCTATGYVPYLAEHEYTNDIVQWGIDFALSAVGDDTGSVIGTVTDAHTSEPIVGALIVVDDPGHYWASDTIGDGTYSIDNVIASSYTVIASAAGYVTKNTGGVQVVTGENTVCDFTLWPVSSAGARKRVKGLGNAQTSVKGREMEDLKLDAYFEVVIQTFDWFSGIPGDADALPIYKVYVEGSDTAVIGATNSAKRDDGNTVGLYTIRFQVTVAAGFAEGSRYFVRETHAIGAVAQGDMVGAFKVIAADAVDAHTDAHEALTRLPDALVDGRVDSCVGAVATGAITAASIATDAITSAELAASAVTEIVDAIDVEWLGNGGTSFEYTVTIDGAAAQGASVLLYAETARTTLGPHSTTNSLGDITFSLTLSATYYPVVIFNGVRYEPDAFTVTA